MTKADAIEAMKQGKKVAHIYFSSDEWMKSDTRGLKYELEDGVKCTAYEFWFWRLDPCWLSGWSIVED